MMRKAVVSLSSFHSRQQAGKSLLRLSYEGVPELGWADREHRTGRFSTHLFRNAAGHKPSNHAQMSLCHHDQIGPLVKGGDNNLNGRAAEGDAGLAIIDRHRPEENIEPGAGAAQELIYGGRYENSPLEGQGVKLA
jgi:hypothetical protein